MADPGLIPSGSEAKNGLGFLPRKAALRAALSEFVIEWGGERIGAIRRGFGSIVTASGLRDVTPHVLRHTAAVHLAATGVSMRRIAQFLGHSDSATPEVVYTMFAPDHIRAVITHPPLRRCEMSESMRVWTEMICGSSAKSN